MNTSSKPQRRPTRAGFTLVEILTVIVIIGILAGIAIPAVTNALKTARTTAMRLELDALEKSIGQYEQLYGDFPPDFSDWSVVQRHYRKLFPRMSADDSGLLFNLLHIGGVYQAAQLDRSEVLYWTLAGYSKDLQRPFTGPGGPLEWTGDGTDTYEAPTGATTPAAILAAHQLATNYQINSDRINSLFDFKTTQLSISPVDPSLPITGTNRLLSNDEGPSGDLFPSYAATTDGAPFVYFDSRTYNVYDVTVADFNGYGNSTFGFVRPYLSTEFNANPSGADYADQQESLAAWKFMKPDTFQLLAPGLDSAYGSNKDFTTGEPLYFQFPLGNGIALYSGSGINTPDDLLVSEIRRYQEAGVFPGLVENFQQDNLANFADSAFINEVE